MQSRSDKGPRFGDFLEQLAGKTIAIVYSYSNVVDHESTWYDRWRSDVICYFGAAVEALGAEPRYIDVDTYLRLMSEPNTFIGHAIINLHSGLNEIGSWPIISSLASWRGVPIVPCSSDVHIVGERKDIANALARTTRMNVPADWVAGTEDKKKYILKPRDLGMSKGIVVTTDRSLIEDQLSKSTYIAQEFIRGFDATAAMVLLPDHSYVVLGAMIYLPESESIHDWILETQAKDERNTSCRYIRKRIEVERSLANEMIALAERLGRSSVFRIDFRVNPDDQGNAPRSLTLPEAHFLEANPTPTISESSSFGELMSAAMSEPALAEKLTQGALVRLPPRVRAQATLVALQLFAAQA